MLVGRSIEQSLLLATRALALHIVAHAYCNALAESHDIFRQLRNRHDYIHSVFRRCFNLLFVVEIRTDDDDDDGDDGDDNGNDDGDDNK